MSKHIYHYNVNAEQRFFLGVEHHNLYDLIGINGNVVSHTPAAIAAFVARTGKEFFIDPQTHAFQHPTIHLKTDVSDKEKKEPPKWEFKPSIEKLAVKQLGSPFADVINNDRPLGPSDFLTQRGEIKNKIIDDVCEKVHLFQTQTLSNSLKEDDKEFLGNGANFLPSFIVSPYFYLSPNLHLEWLKINVATYIRTKKIHKDSPVFFALLISNKALEQNLEGILNEMRKIKPDGILLWVDEQTEENLSISKIKDFIALLKGLKKTSKEVYNIHGGYLSVLLSHNEAGKLISGVGHSINYGESRSVVPVGGGIPLARFYFPSIHSRLKFGDALSIVLPMDSLKSKESYTQSICSCRMCYDLLQEKDSVEKAFYVYGGSKTVTLKRRSGSIVRLEYPTSEAKQAAARHYLYNKKKEFEDLESKTLNHLLKNLTDSYKQILPYTGDNFISHLRTWHDSIKELTK